MITAREILEALRPRQTIAAGNAPTRFRHAVVDSRNVISDPPREMTMELARRQLAALDELRRPTLVTCRTGPRSSALIYLYAGLRSGASGDEVHGDRAPRAGRRGCGGSPPAPSGGRAWRLDASS